MRIVREWLTLRRIRALPAERRRVVFFGDGAATWAHLRSLVEALTTQHRQRVCYVTSAPDDPALESGLPDVEAFCVGSGLVRSLFFMTLEARLAVMTMPDLDSFQIKRSMAGRVHYAYVFHSMVSTHAAYREAAFDHFDTVLCVGPHHESEIRRAERVRGLPAKNLVRHGYGRLDGLIERRQRVQGRTEDAGTPLRVLVAPSWGDEGLLERHGAELTRVLLDAGFQVTVRPHPMTAHRSPEVIERLRREFADVRGFALETDIASADSLLQAHAMVSDWSGAALEYAFGVERPVLFIDVPLKVNNPNWEQLDLEPLERTVRDEIGLVLPPERLADAPDAIRRLCEDASRYRGAIAECREREIFNVGTSAAVGAGILATLANGDR